MKHLPLIFAIILVAALAIFLIERDPPKTSDSDQNQIEDSPSADEVEPTPPDPTPVEVVSLEEEVTSPEADLVEPTPATPPIPDTPATPKPPTHNHYAQGQKTRDGIGKYYQGREIAHVMGHPAIKWLERDNREAEEAPTKAIDLLELGKSDVLADIGAGSGYYSLRIAMKHSQGKVVSVDIQQEMVDFLKNRAEQLDLTNVSTHLGKIDDIGLPAESINAALMVDAYHEFSHPFEMMTSIFTALKPGGRVYLLEYRAEDPTVPIKPLHKMTQVQAKKEMALVGLEWVKTIDDLPWQHFMVFRKP